MVVNKFWGVFAFLILLQHCDFKKSGPFAWKTNNDQVMIPARYRYDRPLARLINLPIMTQKDTVFTLDQDTKVQIYAVGEANIKWVTVPRKYMFRGDVIEYYFDVSGQDLDISISLFDESKEKQEQILHDQKGERRFIVDYNAASRKYSVIAIIPWTSLSVKPSDNLEVDFNLALGDNDDKLKQKARLVWCGKEDPLFDMDRKYGKIRLANSRSGKYARDIIPSFFVEEFDIKILEESHTVPVENLVFGQVNDQEDFSATIGSLWDPHCLYIYTEIRDNFNKSVDYAGIRQEAAFYDFGFIENEEGEVLWTMQNLFAKHAGGALKNQMIDTVIHLKAGKYTLNYMTDESHSWNNWDDKPPQTSFYGIVIYKVKE